MTKLVFIKSIHTAIWFFFNLVIGYMAYAIFYRKIDPLLWWCIGSVFMEGVVLLTFKGNCPLTLLARKHSDSRKDNFDIYLPNWLAKYNQRIYTSIFICLLVLLMYQLST